ncbi:MAG: FAD-dependent oxidoreductase [Candidatus Coatesbacteria bacterium]
MKVAIRRLPPVDVLVVEGTLHACWLALRMRQAGLDVALVMSGTSPCHEAVGCLRPWVQTRRLDAVPEQFRAVFAKAARDEGAGPGETHLHSSDLVIGIEDLLLDAGVRLSYTARPAAALMAGGRLAGVVFGGKFGLVAIEAGFVVDASPAASVARVAGAAFAPREGEPHVSEVSWTAQVRQAPPLRVALEGFKEFSGTLNPRGRYAEFVLKIRSDVSGALGVARTLSAVQSAVAESAERLKEMTPPATLNIFRGADAMQWTPKDAIVCESGKAAVEACRPKGFPALAVTGPCAALPGCHALAFQGDMTRLFDGAPGLDEALVALAKSSPRTPAEGFVMQAASGGGIVEGLEYSFTDPGYREPDATPLEVELDADTLLLAKEVIVAGGGTSGAPAAIAAAEAGLDTILLEAHGGLGGTNTLGGVSRPWFGRWTPGVSDLWARVYRMVRDRGVCASLGLHAVARERGAEVLYGTPVCGVARRGSIIRRVFVVTAHGLASVEGTHVVDATGDGDLAAWGHAPYVWGSERDDITLWYSFGRFHHGQDEGSRHFLSVADLRSLADASRAVIVGRRQAGVFGAAEYPQYLVTPRESRHIVGGRTVTYLDMLMNRRWDDTVTVARSNIDIKGMASSDAAMSGFAEGEFLENYWCGIPYAALLPQGLDNILVVGKAWSATHDAEGMARMQADLAGLGMVAGLAARVARDFGTTLRAADVPVLQERAIAAGLLFRSDLEASDHVRDVPDREEMYMLGRRIAEGPMLLPEVASMLSNPQAARPVLEAEFFDGMFYSAKPMARMLCLLGSTRGADYLLAGLEGSIGGAALSPPPPKWLFDLPDHGWAPDPVFSINALAQIREPRLVPLLGKLAAKLALDPAKSDWRFAYVHAVSYACERIASRDAVPVLRRVMADPPLQGRDLPRGSDSRKGTDVAGERFAYLELCLGRALARCGEADGYRVLARYTGDLRMFLARSALRELADLTGEDRGFDRGSWEGWIAANPRRIGPRPFDRRLA